MKQILLEVEDAFFGKVMNVLEIIPVEVVCSYDVADTKSLSDACVAEAIRELRQDEVFVRPSDYTYIMLGCNQCREVDLDNFDTPMDFILYLKELEFEHLPGRNTLYDGIAKTFGTYPDWTFKDNPKAWEVLRRKNIFRRFLSAYIRARRSFSDGVSDNLR